MCGGGGGGGGLKMDGGERVGLEIYCTSVCTAAAHSEWQQHWGFPKK